MSFREKSAWACLITTIAVFVPYFVYVFLLFEQEELQATSVITAFIAAVVFQVLLQVAAHIVFAVQSRQEQKDERDITIESKSFRNAYFVLASTCFLTIVCVVGFAIAPASTLSGHRPALVFVSQMLLLCFIMAEATKYLTQAVCYRRGS